MDTMTFLGPTFTLEMPTSWHTGASAQFQAVLRSPVADGGVFPNLAVAIRTLEEGVTLKEVLAVARQTQEKEYPGYQLVAESPISAGGVSGVRRVFEWRPSDRDTPVRQQQASYLDGRVLYTLTATRAADSPYAKEIDGIFELMLGSFDFRVPEQVV